MISVFNRRVRIERMCVSSSSVDATHSERQKERIQTHNKARRWVAMPRNCKGEQSAARIEAVKGGWLWLIHELGGLTKASSHQLSASGQAAQAMTAQKNSSRKERPKNNNNNNNNNTNKKLHKLRVSVPLYSPWLCRRYGPHAHSNSRLGTRPFFDPRPVKFA